MQDALPIGQKIADIAKSYIGQEEIKENAGFKDAAFEKKMRDIAGWQTGWAWCACLGKLVWIEAYEGTAYADIVKHACGPSALGTLHNFQQNTCGGFNYSRKPVVGALVIWQEGNTAQGHEGVVIGVNSDGSTFTTVEGNTNTNGSREGHIAAQKAHKLIFGVDPHALNLKGFIIPVKINN